MHATETGVKYAGILSDQMLKSRRIAWSGQQRPNHGVFFLGVTRDWTVFVIGSR
jgi:hypothetical protein